MGDVEYGLIDKQPEMPGNARGSMSPLNTLVEQILGDASLHKQAILIAKYGQQTAAGAAANVLRQRYGKSLAVKGLEFRSARVPNEDKTGLWVYCDPDKVVPGHLEKHQESEKERKARVQENAKKRAEKKAAEEAAKGKAQRKAS